MANSYTANLNLTLPQIGGDTDAWGTDLNNDLTTLDGIFASSGAGTAVGLNTVGKSFNATANNFFLKDGTDATKIAQFSISGNTTATTRTYTLPDLSDTLVTLTATQTLSNKTLAAAALTGITTASGDIIMSGTGEIQIPAGTTTQRAGTPATGMLRYNTQLSAFEGYGNGAWGSIGGGATGGGTDQVFWQNGQTITTSYSIPANTNAGSFGPIAISSTATLTIPSSSTYTVV